MTGLEEKLRRTLRRWQLPPGVTWYVGVSGGADSLALLDALWRWQLRARVTGAITALHVNHQLRGAEADADERFVQTYCAQCGIACQTTRVDVAARARHMRRNLEATAREVREEFFAIRAATTAPATVLTAHTFDDQVETLLARLLRGTAAAGLRGIHEARLLCADVWLRRPLLSVTRAEVLEHCAHYGVEFRTDSSNASLDFTRNRIRHELLPLLRTFNPQIDALLTSFAARIGEDEALLQAQAETLWQQAGDGQRLAVTPLRAVAPALRRRVLRCWLLAARGELTRLGAVHWAALDALFRSGRCEQPDQDNRSGHVVELPGGWRVRREFDWLILLAPTAFAERLVAPPAPVWLAVGQTVRYGNYQVSLQRLSDVASAQLAAWRARGERDATFHVACLVTTAPLLVRSRRAGDAYVPAGRTRAVRVKTLLTRHRIPLSARAAHPLFVNPDGAIVWSPGLPLARAVLPPSSAVATNDNHNANETYQTQKEGVLVIVAEGVT